MMDDDSDIPGSPQAKVASAFQGDFGHFSTLQCRSKVGLAALHSQPRTQVNGCPVDDSTNTTRRPWDLSARLWLYETQAQTKGDSA